MAKSYKIQHPDGRYSSGGAWPHWTKKGKTWSTIGGLKCHIGHVYRRARKGIYDDCSLITLESVESERKPMEEIVKGVMDAG